MTTHILENLWGLNLQGEKMINIEFDKETQRFQIDTGDTLMYLDREDARYVSTRLIEMLTNISLEEYRKDFNYEGSSL